jgi:hypothetical protein
MVARVMWRGQVAPGTRPEERRSLLQDHSGEQRVTNIELFFDLVYVFAVTQLSHHLLARPDVEGALQTALLLALVWWAWVYTTWATNWLDARRIPVRLMLIALMLVSLERVIWGVISWPRIAAVAVLLLLLFLAPHVTALALSIVVVLVLVAVAVSDRFYRGGGAVAA